MTAESGPSRRAWTFGAIGLVAVAAGWFALSLRVAHNTARTAAGEAIGVMLALLVVASVVGAFVGRRGEDAERDERPDSGNREDGSNG
jgi:hypothetical protein